MKNYTILKHIGNLIVCLSLLTFSSVALSETNQNKNLEKTKQTQVEKFRRFQSLNSKDTTKLPDYEYIEKKHNTDRTKFLEKNTK